MNFDDYQKAAQETDLTGQKGDWNDPKNLEVLFGLCGETGEVAEKFKKIFRKNGVVSEEDRQEILKELGDILWYITTISRHLNSSIEEVAKMNIDKLSSRAKRDVLHGSGDNR